MNFYQVYPYYSRYINLDLVKEIVFTIDTDGDEKLDNPWKDYWFRDEQILELEERLKERLK
ncbi:MAG: hypothetical protein QF864_09650 [SAR202 cluster bacterium]|nr:hypothetical protein [SAR202 cluster bacterium]